MLLLFFIFMIFTFRFYMICWRKLLLAIALLMRLNYLRGATSDTLDVYLFDIINNYNVHNATKD